MFLVPIFEALDCVEDLIQNIHTICPNSGILFHINSNCSAEFISNANKLVDFYDFCYVLPKQYPSDWATGYLFNIYVDMMDWCVKKNFCDYIYVTHSNSLLINTQLEENIYKYQLYFPDPGIKTAGDWWEHIEVDSNMFDYISNKEDIIYSIAIEGVAMTLEVAKDCVEDLKPYFITQPVSYPAEEYYIPTSLMYIKGKYKHLNVALERWGHTIDHNVNLYQMDVDSNEDYMVPMILSGQENTLSKLNLYSIKKIKRVYNYQARVLIRNYFGYNNILV
jgi:hypothetical protein